MESFGVVALIVAIIVIMIAVVKLFDLLNKHKKEHEEIEDGINKKLINLKSDDKAILKEITQLKADSDSKIKDSISAIDKITELIDRLVDYKDKQIDFNTKVETELGEHQEILFFLKSIDQESAKMLKEMPETVNSITALLTTLCEFNTAKHGENWKDLIKK